MGGTWERGPPTKSVETRVWPLLQSPSGVVRRSIVFGEIVRVKIVILIFIINFVFSAPADTHGNLLMNQDAERNGNKIGIWLQVLDFMFLIPSVELLFLAPANPYGNSLLIESNRKVKTKIGIWLQLSIFMFLRSREPQVYRVHVLVILYIPKVYVLGSTRPAERFCAAVSFYRAPAGPSLEGGVLGNASRYNDIQGLYRACTNDHLRCRWLKPQRLDLRSGPSCAATNCGGGGSCDGGRGDSGGVCYYTYVSSTRRPID